VILDQVIDLELRPFCVYC